jgi:hypothetical protein
MFKKFFPVSPDPSVNTGAESANAKFGHLNALIEYINNVPPGGGIESVTGSAVDNTDPLNPVINIDGEFLPTAGGTMDEGASINFNSGAKLQQGTTDAGIGGNGGIALRCSIDYELKWEAGRLYVMEQDGFIIREVRYTRTLTPTESDDVTIGFVENSRWVLDNGDTYVCTDPTEDAAVWELLGVATNETLTGTGTQDDKLGVAVYYSSGTWTPTIDNTDVIFQSGFYNIIGDIVTASFTGTFTLPGGSSTADFNFTLPINPNSTFTSVYDVVGIINLHITNSDIIQQRIISNTGEAIGDYTCNARIRSNTNGAFSIHIQYSINN